MPENQFYNAHHSPIGAFASFTLGFPGKKGGFDLEQGRPPEQNIYIGLDPIGGKNLRLCLFLNLKSPTLEAES